MTAGPTYSHRPRLLRHPIERSPEQLVLWPRRATIVLAFVFGAAMLAAWGVGLARTGNTPALIVGVVSLLAGLYYLLTTRPVLIVDRQGLRAPLSRQHRTLPWDEVAGIRSGTTLFTGVLEVFVWAGGDQRWPQRRLFLQSSLLPVRLKELVVEIETYRPPRDGPDLDPSRRPG